MQSCFRLSKTRARGQQSKLKFAPDIVDIRATGSMLGRETQEIHFVPNDNGGKLTLPIVLSGDEPKVTDPAPGAGGKSK
jgi:hypothetical protein